MGLPKRLTEMQMRFAEHLVYGGPDGPVTKTEAAILAGYSKDRARQEGSELTNPKLSPLVVQYIGKLKGMRLDLDLRSGSLKTDIKSLKKAARQAILPELIRRSNSIIKTENIQLNEDNKIYWMENPIAYIVKGSNYLNPKLELLVDEALDLESKDKLKLNLEDKLNQEF